VHYQIFIALLLAVVGNRWRKFCGDIQRCTEAVQTDEAFTVDELCFPTRCR